MSQYRSPDPRTAVAATVAWMLALMATVLAEALGFACQLYTVIGANHPVVRVLASVMLFVACLAGLITLLMIPLVLRVSQRRPPPVIVWLAALAGSLPWFVILLRQFAN